MKQIKFINIGIQFLFVIYLQLDFFNAQCDLSCSTCSGTTANDCTTCFTGTFLQTAPAGPSPCVASGGCPAQTFELGNPDNRCEPCDPTCLTCGGTANNQCLSCDTGLYLTSGNECVATCPGNTVGISPQQLCEICNTGCSKCTTTQINCTECFVGYKHFPTDNTCLTSCPIEFYADGNTPENCLPCTAPCFGCDGGTTNDCTECTGAYYLKNRQCLTDCIDPLCVEDAVTVCGFWQNTGTPPTSYNTCDPCDNTCKRCDGPANVDCLECDFLNKDLHYYFVDNDNRTCLTPAQCYAIVPAPSGDGFVVIVDPNTPFDCIEQPCHSTCFTCNQTFLTDCLTCQPALFQYHTQCVAANSCPLPNYYTDTVTQQCEECHFKCATCQNTYNNCQTCKEEYYFLNDGTISYCFLPCPDGYFEDDTAVPKVCGQCDTSCKTCETTFDNCTSCFEGFYLLEAVLVTDVNTCVTPCPTSGYYVDEDLNYCGPCNQACPLDQCTGPLVADCIDTCQPAQYPDYDSKVCQDCYLGCATCQFSATTCQSCNINFKLVLDQCVDDCPIGQYFDGTTCVNCNGSCYTCSGPGATDCTGCTGTLFLENNECVTEPNCGPPAALNYYGNILNNECDICEFNCSQCYDLKNQCTACQAGYQLQGTDCILCEDNYYHDATLNRCEPCHQECFTCFAGPDRDQCTSCTGGLFLQTGECLVNCNPRFFRNFVNYTCQNCAGGCEVCEGTSTNCFSCYGTRYLLNNACLATCPAGYIGTTNPNVCSPCDPTCYTCTGVLNNQCTSCEVNKRFLLNNQCYKDCPPGYAKDRLTTTCQQCTTGCNICSDDDVNICYECQTGYLLNHQCVNACGTGYYENVSGHICQPCEEIDEFSIQYCNESVCPGMILDPDLENRCTEICGDGMRKSSILECDDGNLIDGDGCNSKCQVEHGWECVGGDLFSADICIDNRLIGFQIELTDSTFWNYDQNEILTFYLNFNKTFTLPIGKEIKDYIVLEIQGYNLDLKFDVYGLSNRRLQQNYEHLYEQNDEISYNDNNIDQIVIQQDQYQFNQKISNNQEYEYFQEEDYEIVEIKNRRNLQALQPTRFQIDLYLEQTVRERPFQVSLFPKTDFSDLYGNGLADDSTQKSFIERYMHYQEYDREFAKKLWWIYPAVLTGVFFNFVHMFYYNFKSQNKFFYSFQIMDIMQTTYLFRFINVRWPLNGFRFFEAMIHWTDFYIPNFFSNPEKNEKFVSELQGFGQYSITTQFLENAGVLSFLFLCLLGVFMILCIFTIEKLYKVPEQNRFYNYLFKIKNVIFQWGAFIDFYMISASVMYTFGLLQLTNMQGVENILTALFVLILYFSFFIYIIYLFLSNLTTLYSEEYMIQKNIAYKKEVLEREKEKMNKVVPLQVQNIEEKQETKQQDDASQEHIKSSDNIKGSQEDKSEHHSTQVEQVQKSRGVLAAEKQLDDYIKRREQQMQEKKEQIYIEDQHLTLDQKLNDATFRLRNLWDFMVISQKENQINYNFIYIMLIIFRKIYIPIVLLTLQSAPILQVISIQLYQMAIIITFCYFGFKILPNARNNFRALISETLTLLGLCGTYLMLDDSSEDEDVRTSRTWYIIFIYLFNMVFHLIVMIFEEIILFLAFCIQTLKEYRIKKKREKEEKEDLQYLNERIEDEKVLQQKDEEWQQSEKERIEAAKKKKKKGFTVAQQREMEELYAAEQNKRPQNNFLGKKPGTMVGLGDNQSKKADTILTQSEFQEDQSEEEEEEEDEIDDGQAEKDLQAISQINSNSNQVVRKKKENTFKYKKKADYFGMKQDSAYQYQEGLDVGPQGKKKFTNNDMANLLGGAVPQQSLQSPDRGPLLNDSNRKDTQDQLRPSSKQSNTSIGNNMKKQARKGKQAPPGQSKFALQNNQEINLDSQNLISQNNIPNNQNTQKQLQQAQRNYDSNNNIGIYQNQGLQDSILNKYQNIQDPSYQNMQSYNPTQQNMNTTQQNMQTYNSLGQQIPQQQQSQYQIPNKGITQSQLYQQQQALQNIKIPAQTTNFQQNQARQGGRQQFDLSSGQNYNQNFNNSQGQNLGIPGQSFGQQQQQQSQVNQGHATMKQLAQQDMAQFEQQHGFKSNVNVPGVIKSKNNYQL